MTGDTPLDGCKALLVGGLTHFWDLLFRLPKFFLARFFVLIGTAVATVYRAVAPFRENLGTIHCYIAPFAQNYMVCFIHVLFPHLS